MQIKKGNPHDKIDRVSLGISKATKLIQTQE